jgi:hypothetical protein
MPKMSQRRISTLELLPLGVGQAQQEGFLCLLPVLVSLPLSY